MDPKIANAVGLLRHQIISPVLMDRGAAQLAHFRKLATRDFEVPGKGPRRFTATTMKGWLYRYRKYGFSGLVPKTRKDSGAFRKITPEMRRLITELRNEHLNSSCVKVYDRCLAKDLLGEPPICMETFRNFLKREGLYQRRETVPRKRFEMNYFGELWTCDFMHGPMVAVEPGSKRKRKAILLAIIDDHSRLIVGHRFGFFENTRLIEQVFKDAIISHGLPDRLYCDNGPSFSSQYLDRVCAYLGIGLVHSKPYDSPSRGKIERFFRTVRSSFLDDVREDAVPAWDLNSLNEAFATWIRAYHHGHHHGISARPIDRYQISIREYPKRRVSEEQLDEFFLVSFERLVGKDCTVSMNTVVYEVPAQFIGKRVELKFSQETPTEIFLYDNGVRITRVRPVDSRHNGKNYKPTPRISDVALHGIASDPTPRSSS
jgi:transposase InsO family protein